MTLSWTILLHGGERASASLQPGETTFDADQTAREFWQGQTPTRAPTLSEFQRTWLRGSRPISRSGGRACETGGRSRWRNSVVRDYSGLPVEDLGAPTDVLWMRLSRHANDPELLNSRLVGFRQLSGFFEERRHASADK